MLFYASNGKNTYIEKKNDIENNPNNKTPERTNTKTEKLTN